MFIFFTLFSFVLSLFNGVKGETIFDELFENNLQEYNRVVDELFSQFDKDKDGYITNMDIQVFWNDMSFEGMLDDGELLERTKKFVWEEFKRIDTLNDGNISLVEFQTKLQSYKDFQVQCDSNVCEQASSLTDSCEDEINKNTSILYLKTQIAIENLLCKAGISVLEKYKKENCVIKKSKCPEIISCYEEGAIKTYNDVVDHKLFGKFSLFKRSWYSWFWVSMLTLGILSDGTPLVVTPFPIIVLIVSSKVNDWNRVQ